MNKNDLSFKNERERNRFLRYLMESLRNYKKKIMTANKKDLEIAARVSLSAAFCQRLKFGEKELENTIKQLEMTRHLKSGIGKVIEKKNLSNGVILKKVRVPIGVILVVFESRPEVVIDVVSLCIKSGNTVILKGGKEAKNTNKVLFECVQLSLELAKFPIDSVRIITDKKSVYKLIRQKDNLDLVIARGGYKMVAEIIDKSKVPVLAHSSGGARIYVDVSADLKMALNIIINAKVSKPSACNSLDTILVSEKLAPKFLPELIARLKTYHVEIITERESDNLWDKEFLSLKIGIKIVKGVEEAVDFIRLYGKHHSEGIIAEDKKVINRFSQGVDAAGIFVNCSTRLHDGSIFGMGTEMGIATGKLHARGPVGIDQLSTYKYVLEGTGQIRD